MIRERIAAARIPHERVPIELEARVIPPEAFVGSIDVAVTGRHKAVSVGNAFFFEQKGSIRDKEAVASV